MQLGVHPLVVAVALGLLGPVALEEENDVCETVMPCAGCDCGLAFDQLAEVAEVSPEAQAEAAAAFARARELVG